MFVNKKFLFWYIVLYIYCMYNVHIVLNIHKACGLGALFFIYFHHIFQQMKSIVFSAQLVEMFQGFFHLMENSV